MDKQTLTDNLPPMRCAYCGDKQFANIQEIDQHMREEHEYMDTEPLCPSAWAVPPSPMMLKHGNDYYTCNLCLGRVDTPNHDL